MGTPSDYQDEMDQREVIERLRAELLESPEPVVARRHLARMHAAADTKEDHVAGRTRKRLGSLALAAALVLGAGIAAALTLPEQANEHAKDRTGDLVVPGPGNQGKNAEETAQTASDHGTAVSEVARDDTTQGCEHGRAVSELASSGADGGHRQNEGHGPDPCQQDEQSQSHGNGAAASAPAGSNGNHGPGAGQSAEEHGNAGDRSDEAHGLGVELNPGNHGGPPDTPGAPGDVPTPNKR